MGGQKVSIIRRCHSFCRVGPHVVYQCCSYMHGSMVKYSGTSDKEKGAISAIVFGVSVREH